MSFLGGAECSTATNPLSQFTKHIQDDKGLQHDRLTNGANTQAPDSFRSAPTGASQDELVNRFLNQEPQLPTMPAESASESQAHQHIDANSGMPANAVDLATHPDPSAWEAEFNAHQRAHDQQQVQFSAQQQANMTNLNVDEFAKFNQMNQAGASSHPAQQLAFTPQTNMTMNMTMGIPPMMTLAGPMVARPIFAPSYQMPMPSAALFNAQQQQPANVKGKGNMVDVDNSRWEEVFARLEMEEKKKQQQQKREDDAAQTIEAELNKTDEQLLQHSETGHGDLEAIWRGIQGDKGDKSDLDHPYDMSFDMHVDWDADNPRLGSAPRSGYVFQQQNIYANHPNPFEEGVRILKEGGSLSLAALAFEAAIQCDPKHVDAWVYLGSAQAQNEKEAAAISALERALNIDPNNLAALMSLAVSYTNEGYDSTAFRTLERWLSVKYPQILPPSEVSVAANHGFTDRFQLHERVTSLFIRAAQLAPSGTAIDPDVQVGLGVLFYSVEDFSKAVDCFAAALASSEQGTTNQRDQLHLLWNRLGATLANSGRSEEAIEAYEKALALRPNFVRARYNLGVSCINLGVYVLAAQHLLVAIQMHNEVQTLGREQAREVYAKADDAAAAGSSSAPQLSDAQLDALAVSGQHESATLYDTLRRVFIQMGWNDLANQVVFGMDPAKFIARLKEAQDAD